MTLVVGGFFRFPVTEPRIRVAGGRFAERGEYPSLSGHAGGIRPSHLAAGPGAGRHVHVEQFQRRRVVHGRGARAVRRRRPGPDFPRDPRNTLALTA